MKKVSTLLVVFLIFIKVSAQIDANLLLQLTNATTTEIGDITNPIIGSLIFNTTRNEVHQFNGITWQPVGNTSNTWAIIGNSDTNAATNFIGTIDAQDFVLKSNNIERLRLSNSMQSVLVNQALEHNNHPLIIRANGNDVLAFQNNTGVTEWHWNILGNGLNFVETGIADYRLFLEKGGNIGINTSNPDYTLDINGTAKINDTPTISTANKVLVKDPTTGQISEQSFAITGKFLMRSDGRAYFYNNTWYSLNDIYGTSYRHWNSPKGAGVLPAYNTNGQSGIPITSTVRLIKFTMKNDFNANQTGTQYLNLSVLRNGAYININTYTINGGSTIITFQTEAVNFSLQENDLLVWAVRTVGGNANRFSHTNITFEFGY